VISPGIEPVRNDGRWTAYQAVLVAGTALAIVVDGLDIQLLGNAIPSLMKEWTLPRGAFSSALAMSPLGMLVGGAFGGWLGDRIGRRTALLASVLTFGALTAITASASSVGALGVLRFLAGLGLGGALPNAAALASEYVSVRQRPLAVTLTIVCVPLGGMVAAFLAARVIPAYGWRALFIVGGLVPVLLGAILFRVLPESPGYVAGRRDPSRGRLAGLFMPSLRRDTLALFGAFFFCLLANYLGFLLLVPTLTGAGFTQPAASDLLGWWNIGGVAGALTGAVVLQRLGSRLTMLGLSAVAVASAIILSWMRLDPQNTSMLLTMCILLGGTLNAVQTTMYALAVNVYPTEIRGTGLGTCLAVGRVGNVLAAYVGNFALDRGGVPAYFWAFAIAMVVVFVALAAVRRHIGTKEDMADHGG
jgi:AAHS family 4-hydroxybenzoate transporter-like MFS transporter